MRQMLNPLLRKSHVHLEKPLPDGIEEGIEEWTTEKETTETLTEPEKESE